VTDQAPPAPSPPPRPPLARSRDGRIVAGVCAGLARYTGLNPILLRLAVVILTLAGGLGVVLYVAAWLVLPLEGDERSMAASVLTDRRFDPTEIVAVGAVVLGGLLLLRSTGIWFGDAIVWPVVLSVVGLAVIWRQAGDDDKPSLLRVVDRLPRPGGGGAGGGGTAAAPDVRSRRAALARVVGGVALVVAGIGMFLAASDAFSAVRQGVLATAGIVAGLALITGPFWLRMGRDLAKERRERIRSEERADFAAHLHDSVLQTLALIQRNADDPRAVVTMARRQERELRSWLYEHSDAIPGPDTLAAAVTRVAEAVEADHGVTFDVVAVGDCPLDDHLTALVAAAREAMVNAARWSGAGSVSIYSEVAPDEVKVFVRDWGSGFDPDTVPADRHGVRESITGRMARHGGEAVVRTAPGEGTEVQLRVTRVTQ
jgi:phage shock protein PspC (stress-responsive transcriptional regulator)